jgi:hypothetical protein
VPHPRIEYRCGESTYCHRPQNCAMRFSKAQTICNHNGVKGVYGSEKHSIYAMRCKVGQRKRPGSLLRGVAQRHCFPATDKAFGMWLPSLYLKVSIRRVPVKGHRVGPKESPWQTDGEPGALKRRLQWKSLIEPRLPYIKSSKMSTHKKGGA